ncbi:isoprenylcysteine carboxylmethyltransferase family protein [Flavimobilis sp. GY10621]|uniref:Isoprenylcysteine carboxylmethyltransferase family protein n=2 Tax=Flavimobilis rhizosphaerae TaxID=2775421 RepID=A0ABR9DMP6_9MICO|nr:isoprenylcysteine carboxylmethyltransferase family protein [Flavimobilis rhizosphaerae]
MVTMSLRLPPPVIAAAALAAQRALARGREPTRASTLAATAVGVGSAALGAGAVLRFHARGTTLDPVHVGASTLVVNGPNYVTRNPMYLALAGALTSYAIWRRTPLAALPVAAFLVAIDRLQVPVEEAVLHERFGAEYERYVATTPRWLGWP